MLYSEHMDGEDGEAMFRHACAMGLEGIVSKRVDSRYKSGRCDAWVKVKNPAYERRDGRVAQRIEHQPSKLRGAGSSPAAPTTFTVQSPQNATGSKSFAYEQRCGPGWWRALGEL